MIRGLAVNVSLDTPQLWTPPANGTALPPPVGRPRYTRDHTQLPFKDETVVSNLFENPQSFLLTSALDPVLARRHPDGRYCIGGDNFIYFNDTDPPANGAKAPDWYYVPNVPQTVGGVYRRSYVLWRERVPPLVVIEYASGNGDEERDRTPNVGKFWAYEQAIRAEYYVIHEPDRERVEVFRLVDGGYQTLPPNERGHYPVEPLGVELGIWQGTYRNMTMAWLRWWDAAGNLLPTAEERATAEQERAERLAAKLREMGIDPDSV
jgi:Uma2 family endonuclease